MATHKLTYQNLIITYKNPKTLGNKMRELLEKGVNSCTLTPRGIEYQVVRKLMRFFTGKTHIDPYPNGVTADRVNRNIYDRSCCLDVDVQKMHDWLGSDPKPKPKPLHRRWMTPEQYEASKHKKPTLSTMLL